MVGPSEETTVAIARLEGRVARLEELLAERSRLLRFLARGLCEEDLLALSRAEGGLPPLLRSDVGSLRWHETTRLTAADVEETMTSLWLVTAPFHAAGQE